MRNTKGVMLFPSMVWNKSRIYTTIIDAKKRFSLESG